MPPVTRAMRLLIGMLLQGRDTVRTARVATHKIRPSLVPVHDHVNGDCRNMNQRVRGL